MKNRSHQKIAEDQDIAFNYMFGVRGNSVLHRRAWSFEQIQNASQSVSSQTNEG